MTPAHIITEAIRYSTKVLSMLVEERFAVIAESQKMAKNARVSSVISMNVLDLKLFIKISPWLNRFRWIRLWMLIL